MRVTGRTVKRTVAGEEVAPFVPYPLPPRDPPLAVDGARAALLTRAEQALARLEIAGAMVPSVDWFIYAFVRKEAVLSSQIEGTQATLIDLLEFEAGQDVRATDDVREVCNYLDATRYARGQLESERGLPLSMRLLNEAHRRLMRGVRGAHKQPGEVRRSQNWIGGTRPANAAFVPPPPEELPALIGQLEGYLDARDGLPTLVRIGLAHAQFETLHPYLDGNGRIGRLLITLLLGHWRLLSAPLLYLSLFFKRHRPEYYRLLDAVRKHGDWEAWTDFFLEGVTTIADEAVATAREVFTLVNADRERLLAAGSASVMAMRLMERLPMHPIVSIPTVVRLLKTTKPTAGKAVRVLESLHVLTETSGKQRDRTYAYAAYLEKLRAGTDIEPHPTARRSRRRV
ncbi:MAG TPA: Fic/DOC family N-terminal domain-containing protein [Steroidobacteraceae bacterium]|nr:Fic/DOC family N-terminal domain-containing protein [Steroidobacteraceae bacterium]